MTVATRQRPVIRTAAPEPPCIACGYHRARALPAHPVCAACAHDPDAARAALARARRLVEARQASAARASQAAYDALADDERLRWSAYMGARAAVEAGTADDETRARVETAAAAFKRGAAPPALLRCWQADECLYWATEEWATDVRRLDVALATLELCVEDIHRAA